MSDQLNRETAGQLAALLRGVRPAWDLQATLNALAEIRGRGDVAYVAYRCLKAALDPANATPHALTFASTWAEPDAHRRMVAPQPPRMQPGEFRATDPAPSDRRAQLIAQARQNIQPPPAPQEDQ